MSLRDDLAGVLARDPRYSIHAYAFVLEALEHAKMMRKRARHSTRGRRRTHDYSQHVTGRDLCEGARQLALRQYGLMAMTVLAQWGVHSTSDLGNIVYNLIASGDLEKAPTDRRSDFDNVFDFETAFRREYVLALDDVA
ncbi:MAG: hypothetical protein IRY99_24435 [Isosphaeraceae bacterium]|nr:hypothetical protein [Isosphaeraceae bacterium]